MKTIFHFFILLTFASPIYIYAQSDLFKDGVASLQLDTYQDQIISFGINYNNNSILSVLLKKSSDSIFSDITKNQNLELNLDSKVHFDNYGNIWAFGKYHLWKYDGSEWSKFPTHPDLLPARYFYDFVFDDENNIWASTRKNFERLRTNDGGTVVVVLDSFQNEFIKISTINSDFEVIKKYYFDEADFVTAIHAITKRNDGAIVIHQNGEKDNLIIYKDGNTEYQTTPIIASGMNSRVSSMTYDKYNNLWISVKTHDYQFAPYNGIYKIMSDGSHTHWDSSAGLRYELFSKRGIRAILGVETVSVSDSGEVWCGTEFGFFSLDESKPWVQQINLYTRDSLDEKYRLFRYGGFFDHPFEINDVAFVKNKIYFSNKLAVIEYDKSKVVTSVNDQASLTPSMSLEVFPLPCTDSDVFLTIRNAEFINTAFLSIVDLSGRTLQNMQIENSSCHIQIPIDTKDLPSGIYYAVLQIGGNITTKKFIVQ